MDANVAAVVIRSGRRDLCLLRVTIARWNAVVVFRGGKRVIKERVIIARSSPRVRKGNLRSCYESRLPLRCRISRILFILSALGRRFRGHRWAPMGKRATTEKVAAEKIVDDPFQRGDANVRR